MLAAVTILAQDSSNVPNCTDNQYNWTYNSLDQSPCYVAVALISMVNAGQTYTLPSVTFLGQIYGLEPGSNTLYFCNTVWYSLLSACALCQDGSWFTWPVYSQNCSQTYLMEYPGPIPSNTSVPTWAFLNVTATNDNFDPAKASSLAVAPSPTSSASTSSAATSSTSTSSTSTSTSHPTPNTSKVGAIAGGTIGGFVIALLVLTLLFYLHKRHNGTTPAPVPLTERSISMRIVPSQELYNSDEIFPIPPTRTPQDEVLSGPRRPSGQPPRRLVHSIQTDSGTTWYSE
ncbi:hypothetical protein F5887DRAFT_475351 [Amanita rubescens]|nr:hypothetical protein F5887DRAFT_475351 [Amanita rubescens]